MEYVTTKRGCIVHKGTKLECCEYAEFLVDEGDDGVEVMSCKAYEERQKPFSWDDEDDD